jgi:hypothetical protein
MMIPSAHPCSTPYSVEQVDPDPRPRRGLGSSNVRRWEGGFRAAHFLPLCARVFLTLVIDIYIELITVDTTAALYSP